MNTVVMQENIEFTKSDIGFFTVSTQHDRSATKSVDAFIHQGKQRLKRMQQRNCYSI